MSIKHMTLTCAILIAAYTTLGFGFQNVNGQKAPAKPAVSTAAAKAKPSAPKPQTKPQAALATTKDPEKERISQFVYTVRHKLGRKYADRVADAIVTSARRNGLSPAMVATTAYIESEFEMTSKPCIGIMQILPSTARNAFGKSGLNPYDLEDNIEMGARYLALHYGKYARSYSVNRGTLASRSGSTASRGSSASRSSRSGTARSVLTAEQQMLVMRQTWSRYNGSSMNGGYQRKATKVLKRMTEWTPEAWKKHVNTKGPLWKR
jgi:soluble lytic murein transglycosylase-like protein